MSNNSPIIKIMLSASNKAARILIRDFNELRMLQSSRNPLERFVNNSISAAERKVIEVLERARPEFSILTKNQEITNGKDRWFVSIISGQKNFMRSIPYFAISIALEMENYNGKQELIAGIIEAPILDEIYFTEKGNGAWFEESSNIRSATHRVRVSEKKEMDLLATNCMHFQNSRDFGCKALSLAYLAAGKFDSCLFKKMHYCDVAAGILLIEEAGGVVEDYAISSDNSIPELKVSNNVVSVK